MTFEEEKRAILRQITIRRSEYPLTTQILLISDCIHLIFLVGFHMARDYEVAGTSQKKARVAIWLFI